MWLYKICILMTIFSGSYGNIIIDKIKYKEENKSILLLENPRTASDAPTQWTGPTSTLGWTGQPTTSTDWQTSTPHIQPTTSTGWETSTPGWTGQPTTSTGWETSTPGWTGQPTTSTGWETSTPGRTDQPTTSTGWETSTPGRTDQPTTSTGWETSTPGWTDQPTTSTGWETSTPGRTDQPTTSTGWKTSTPGWTDQPTTSTGWPTSTPHWTPETTSQSTTTQETTTTVKQTDLYYLLFNSNVRGSMFTSSDYDIPIDPDVGTVIIIHEHGGFAGDTFSCSLRRAFDRYHNLNVFLMNWMTLSADYEQAVSNSHLAAKDLAKFLEILRQIKVVNNNRDLHLIGFGIGAHLAGDAGDMLKDISQIGRISGLSPTETERFNYTHILSQSDAAYVEVIHTNNDKLGYGITGEIGHVDFYPNGGARQPGCWSHRCSHERAFQLFEASLEFDHLVGHRCIDMYQMHDNKCNGMRLHLGGAEVMKVPMLPGVFRLDTGPLFPFEIQPNVNLN